MLRRGWYDVKLSSLTHLEVQTGAQIELQRPLLVPGNFWIYQLAEQESFPHRAYTTDLDRPSSYTLMCGAERGLPSPSKTSSTTMKIRSINREAKQNDRLRDRLNLWKDVMREKGKRAWSSFAQSWMYGIVTYGAVAASQASAAMGGQEGRTWACLLLTS